MKDYKRIEEIDKLRKEYKEYAKLVDETELKWKQFCEKANNDTDCDNCQYLHIDFVEDGAWTYGSKRCLKNHDIYLAAPCEDFVEDEPLKLKQKIVTEHTSHTHSFQGATLNWSGDSNLKCGDTFVITNMSKHLGTGIFNVELTKVEQYVLDK